MTGRFRASAKSGFFAIRLRVDDLRIGVSAGQPALFGGQLQGFFAVELGLMHEFVDARGERLRGVDV
jgi:hypothetical protein